MKYKPSLFINVLIPIIILIAIIHLFIFYQSYSYYKKIIIHQKKAQIDHTLKELHNRLIFIKDNIEILGDAVSETYSLFHPTKPELIDLLKKYLLYPGISGVGFITPLSSEKSCLYIWQQDGKIRSNNPADWFKHNAIDYTSRPFYKVPYDTGKPYFCKPAPNDAGDKKYSATYSIPMYNRNSKFIGVITLDLMLTWIDEIFAVLTAKENINYSFISKKGDFLVKKDKDYMNSAHVECIREIVKEISESKKIKEEFENKNDTDFILDKFFPKEKIFVRVSTVFNGQAYLFVFFNENKALAVLKEAMFYQAVIVTTSFIIIFICLYFLLIFCLTPIRKITSSVKNIARGDFETDFRVKSITKEIVILNRAIRIMQLRLKHYFDKVTDNTRLKTEMEFAKRIQENLIPEYSKKKGLDVHWILFPAEEVGGDFCNYIYFETGTVYMSIGDVTGKGIPAALYTAVMITMEKLLTKISIPLQKMVKIINSEIIKFNRSELYVSYFNTVINTKTGTCKYVNAGHLPVLILKSDGHVIKTKRGTGTFLGIFDTIKFNKEKIQLGKGDTLLCYTDGVTEAVNENNKLFGEMRLIKLLESCHDLTSKEVIDKIYKEVVAFRGLAAQSDDICMICYRQK